MGKNLVIFDFDGVISDSAEIHRRAYSAVFAEAGLEFPLRSLDAWREQYQSTWELNFTRNGIPPAAIRGMLDRYWDFVDYSSAPIFSGIPEVIRTLSAQHHLAILSSTKATIIDAVLSKAGLRGCFQGIDGRDDCSDKGQKLGTMLAAHSLPARNAVMIGDTESDIRAAMENNVPGIAVTYGWYPRHRFAAVTPSAFADYPKALLSALTTIWPD